jgi:drug/metabolite transporter superfamily protein YnfA
MSSLYAIGWFLLLAVSILSVFELVGMRTMVNFFPEGRRWWQLPAQLVSLAIFAVIVISHPFKG